MSHKGRRVDLLLGIGTCFLLGIFWLTVSTIQTNQIIQQQFLDRSVVTIATNEDRALVFYKDDCSDCQEIFPELYKENLANDHLLFINLNQPRNKDYIAKYQLKTVPTIVTPKGKYAGTDTKKIHQLLEDQKKE
ncbi:thioredoxin domain-containing protein [Enterococcus sp. 5B3_DIV0040]|uniref:thioredoxin domain-containing protein n=1 Tax=Enterococcus sp. 5B3_DIV0040 TaxID=1834182 RepID=UPI000A340AD7|nr:thioredoxin domain-containing protein [Enterococcus sp. 5B3_DIV0040]OTO02237.1 hypothetical protein A5883_003064 [Enterococcus sp. 5B3_DIV0040]